MSKSKSKAEEAAQLLDDLENITPGSAAGNKNAGGGGTEAGSDPEDVLKFLEDLTTKSSKPTKQTPMPSLLERPASRTGTVRKSTERVRLGQTSSSSAVDGQGSSPPTRSSTPAPRAGVAAAGGADGASGGSPAATPSASGWGWGSVWSSASAALAQAKSTVDQQVKNLPVQVPNNASEQAKKWGADVLGYVNKENIEKFSKDFRAVGLNTLTDILNAVAPPISEHEVIHVTISHDMEGYEGVESLVYKALGKILEQVEGGDLIVNKGNESKPKDTDDPDRRDMHPVEGIETAARLAGANISELVKANVQDTKPEAAPSSTKNPTTHSYVYIRIQPFLSKASFQLPATSAPTPVPEGSASAAQDYLQFLLHFSDPGHDIAHTSVTQTIPAHWLDMWEEQDFVEDLVADTLRSGVEVVGQEYVIARMGWGKGKKAMPGAVGEVEGVPTQATENAA